MSSGFIIAGAYANKLRRVLFASLKGKVDPKEIARAAGELNATLFDLLRTLNVDKGDVVRIIIDYEIEDGTIKWNWQSLELQHYKAIPETTEKAKQLILEIVEKRRPIGAPEIAVEYLGPAAEGLEDVFKVKAVIEGREEVVGAARITYADEEGKGIAVIRMANMNPCKVTFTVPYSQDPSQVAENVRSRIQQALVSGEYEELSGEEAKKLLEEILAL